MTHEKHGGVPKDGVATCNRPWNVIVHGDNENSEMSEPCWLWKIDVMRTKEAANAQTHKDTEATAYRKKTCDMKNMQRMRNNGSMAPCVLSRSVVSPQFQAP